VRRIPGIRWLFGLGIVSAILWIPGVRRADAQEIEFVPAAHPAEILLDLFLRRQRYVVWSRDTVLAPGSRVEGDVLVLQAQVRLAGEITGSVYVVDGDLFLRPGGRVGGDAVVLGGGFYPSRLATIDGRLFYRPNDRFAVMPRAGGYRITAVHEEPRALHLDGLYGFRLPLYQRVNAWTFGLGGDVTATGLPWRPSLDLVGNYHTGQKKFEGTARQVWHPSDLWSFGVEAGRATLSNDTWIRRDFSNSLQFLFHGDDFRNYYRADRAAFTVKGAPELTWSPMLRVQWEDARSLVARPRTVLFAADEPVRPNPLIDRGETWSAIVALAFHKRTSVGGIAARVKLEGADSTVAGDFSFLLGEAKVSWSGRALAHHRLEIFAIGRGDLAGRLPRQRWSAFGGLGTLPTFPVLDQRGARMVFGRFTYLIPLSGIRVALAGSPQLFVREAIGSAWGEGQKPHFEQNVTLGIRLAILEASVALDPGVGGQDGIFILTANLPGDL